MSEEKEPVAVYVIKTGRPVGFNFRIEKDKMRIRFENGRFETFDSEVAAEIDKILAKVPNINQNVMKVDYSQAEAFVKAHMAANPTSAAKGGLTAEIARSMQDSAAIQQQADLKSKIAPKDVAKLESESHLTLTETVQQSATPVTQVAEPEKTSGFSLGVAK